MKRGEVDAWMYLAIAISTGDAKRVGLSRLVAAADGINHAIPTDDELRTGINRLINARLVSERGTAFALTPAGAALFSRFGVMCFGRNSNGWRGNWTDWLIPVNRDGRRQRM